MKKVDPYRIVGTAIAVSLIAAAVLLIVLAISGLLLLLLNVWSGIVSFA